MVVKELLLLLLTVLFEDCEADILTSVGRNANLPCQTTKLYPIWRGPSASNGIQMYNYIGRPNFTNQNVGEKNNRLKWENSVNLTIIDVTRSDEGIYDCQPVNESRHAEVELKVRVQPHTVQILNAITISSGLVMHVMKNVIRTLTCKSSGGYPEQDVQWKKGSDVLKSTNSGSVLNNTTKTYDITQEVQINPTQEDDNVDYECISSFRDEPTLTTRNVVKLYLNLEPSLPTIIQLRSLNEGDNTSIAKCQTDGFRPHQSFIMKWTYQSLTTTANGSLKEEDDLKYSAEAIYQRQVTREDNAKVLTCSVFHETMTGSKNRTLTIQVKFRPLFANLSGNQDIVADGVNRLTLTCTSGTANPVSTMSWKVNDVITLRNGTAMNTSGSYGGISRQEQLILTPTRHNDGDRITCEVWNELNSLNVSNSTVLDLRYPPWIDTLSDVTVVEGNYSILNCSVSSKPPSHLQWFRENQKNVLSENNGTIDNNRLVYNLSNVRKENATTYGCRANNGIEESTRTLVLTVLYPPVVSVELHNISVKRNKTTLICKAEGIPNSKYTYGKWVHKWPGIGVLSDTIGSQTLDLYPLTYEYSGTYICSASNGVKLFGTEDEFMEGSAYLVVESAPVITNSSETARIPGRKDSVISTAVEFYTNVNFVTAKCYKYENGSRGAEFACLTFLMDYTVNLKVFSKTVSTPGKLANISIPIKSLEDFGLYHIEITNKEDSSFMAIDIVAEGPPDPPYNIEIEDIYQSAIRLSWFAGFDGGFDQTFVVQISTDEQNWKNSSNIFDEINEKKVTGTLGNLAPSTSYFLRLYAFNIKGSSSFTETYNITTLAADTKESSLPSALIGGVAGGIFAIVIIAVIVAVVVFMQRRGYLIKGGLKSGETVDSVKTQGEVNSSDEDETIENPLYDGGSNPIALYSTPQKKKKKQQREKNVAQLGDVYATVDKSHKSARNEKKGKQKTLPQGDIYENSPKTSNVCSNAYGNQAFEDNPYENPAESKSSKNMKKNVNQDGLVYADLTFNEKAKGQKKLIIHGLDQMTEYVQVDFSKKAEPLPDSDTEETHDKK